MYQNNQINLARQCDVLSDNTFLCLTMKAATRCGIAAFFMRDGRTGMFATLITKKGA